MYLFSKPQSKKEEAFQNRFFPKALIILLITIGIAVALYCCNVVALTWLFFIILGVFLPISFVFGVSKLYFTTSIDITEKAVAFIEQLVYTIAGYFYIGFAIAIVDKHLQGIFACGCIIVIIQVVMLSKSFISIASLINNKLVSPFNFILMIRSLISLGITIYMIYIIPESYQNLQIIVITIVAAIFGGMITLIGVAWTIKRSDDDKKEKEIQKAKPYFCINLKADYEFDNDIMSYVRLLGENTVTTNARFKNSGTSNFYLKRLYINGKWYKIYGNTLIITNQKFQIYFNYVDLTESSKKSIAYLEVQDILDNLYYYKLTFAPSFDESVDKYNILLSCNEILKDNIPKECWEEGREVPFGNNKEAEVIKNNDELEEKDA